MPQCIRDSQVWEEKSLITRQGCSRGRPPRVDLAASGRLRGRGCWHPRRTKPRAGQSEPERCASARVPCPELYTIAGMNERTVDDVLHPRCAKISRSQHHASIALRDRVIRHIELPRRSFAFQKLQLRFVSAQLFKRANTRITGTRTTIKADCMSGRPPQSGLSAFQTTDSALA